MSKTSSALAPAPADTPTIKAPAVTAESNEAPAKPKPGATPSAAVALAQPQTEVLTPTTQATLAGSSDAKGLTSDTEPQNLLTDKFTADEWKALKELRVRLY